METRNLNLENKPTASLTGLKAPSLLDQFRHDTTYSGFRKKVEAGKMHLQKPNPQLWFQLHPTWSFSCRVLNIKQSMRSYILDPGLPADATEEGRFCEIFAAITRKDTLFFWPIKQQVDERPLDSWTESSHEAAFEAKSSWVRMQANCAQGRYDARCGAGNSPDWSKFDLDTLFERVLGENSIDHPDHLVLRQLRGEVC